MSGSLGLTIREPNGAEHRMCVWTNVISPYINNLKLVEKDPLHIQNIVKDWHEMKEDYADHEAEWKALQAKYGEDASSNQLFRDCVTPDCVPYPFLAPRYYGLIVVDMVNNQILDYQGHSELGRISSISIAADLSTYTGQGYSLETAIKNVFNSTDEYSPAMRFKRFYEAGRVIGRNYLLTRVSLVTSLNGKSLEHIARMIEGGPGYYDFPLDFSPFQITPYKEFDPEEARKMQGKIEELGFKLTDKEKAIWDTWVTEEADEEDSD